jgi:hypothetical protein
VTGSIGAVEVVTGFDAATFRRGDRLTARAECPPGQVALGGGFVVVPDDHDDQAKLIPYADHVTPEGWLASITATAHTDLVTLMVSAVCTPTTATP